MSRARPGRGLPGGPQFVVWLGRTTLSSTLYARITTLPKMFHLGWFTSFAVDEWNEPFGSGGEPWDGSFYIEMAKAMERACFDYLMLEDTLMLSEAYGGTSEAYLKAAIMVPKHDPAPLAALIGAATTRISASSTTMSTHGLSAVPARAPLFDARSHRQGPVRLEHRDERRGHRPRRTSASTSCRRASCATRWPRNTWPSSTRCSTPGSRARSCIDRESRHLRRPYEGRADPFQGQIFFLARPAQHGALAAGAPGLYSGGRLADRPGVRRPATPIRSSPSPTASRA